ncbi:Vacuolar morphogenesis protein 6 [Coemansia sp. BCRC 34301]|nr:Vacuolar morphogenesis protein 6 [Coemansia sp. BCRC 34301]
MHNAFEIRAVLRQLPVRIESAVAYSDRLLLGTATGALLMYRVVEPTKERALSISLIETKKAFARKAIEHLDVIKEAGVLVCLADGMVTLYDLHSLSGATPLNNTKGANLIAVHTAVDHIDGIPTLVSKLAIHAKRKLVVLEWRDAEFYKSLEYTAAERITAMQFASASLLVLSTAREFLTLQLAQNQWDDLFPADTASLRTVAAGSLSAAGSNSNGSRVGGPELASSPQPASTGGGGMWGSWGIGLSGPSTEVKTIIARMPGEKLLLCHESIGVFINSVGKLCRQEYSDPTLFGRAPTGVTHTSSYVIAISSDHGGAEAAAAASGSVSRQPTQTTNVEVRNIGTQALVQQLCLAEEAPTQVFNGAGGKQVWAVGRHTVWRLLPAPIQQQVEDVLAAGQYDEALSLVARSDSILESEKEDLTVKIRWLRARWLFRDQAKYEEALSELTDLGATPTEAIALCPERIAGELAEEASDADIDGEADEAGGGELNGGDDQHKQLQQTEPTDLIIGRGRSKPRPKQVIWKEALYALMRYLTEHRRWLQRAAADGKRELEYVVRVLDEVIDGDSDDANSDIRRRQQARLALNDDDSLPHVRLHRLRFSLEHMEIPVAAMAQVVDTTLLKVYLECSPGLLGPLLRVKNQCDVEKSEGLLIEHRRFSELVDLYHGKGLYRKALQLLQSRGMSPDGGALQGTYPTVRYLLRLPADQFELVLEYIRWPLQTRPAPEPSHLPKVTDSPVLDEEDWPSPSSVVALVFTDDRPAAEAFPRPRVSSFLRLVSPTLVIQYLTHVFEAWNDETGVLHDDMVAAYLDLICSSQSDNCALDGQLRHALQHFLRVSKSYSPEKALARLPGDGLLQERALVLSRLGRHEHALGLLVFGVASLVLAEQYCVDNVSACTGIFVLLLKILVGPPPLDIIDNEAALLRSGDLGGASGGACSTAAQTEDLRQVIHRRFAGHFLSTHHQHIPAADALRLLPPDLDFTPDLLAYLRGQLCALDQATRASDIVRNLRVGEDMQSKRHLHHLQSGYVLISETRTCPHCLKRIGSGTAFAVVPSQEKSAGPAVVHYSCLTSAIATLALAVAGTAFAAAPEPTHAVKGKAAAAPEARTVTVTTTINRNGATANQVSIAAAALAGALAFASYM